VRENVLFLVVLACFWVKTAQLDELSVRLNDLLVRLERPAMRWKRSTGWMI
jgi:hypothetical protein